MKGRGNSSHALAQNGLTYHDTAGGQGLLEDESGEDETWAFTIQINCQLYIDGRARRGQCVYMTYVYRDFLHTTS